MSPRAWVAFAAVSTLWGVPYLFIKVAVDDGVPPAFLAWVRVVLGAAVLLALAWSAGVLPALRCAAVGAGCRSSPSSRSSIPFCAHRGGRAARLVVAGRDHRRGGAAAVLFSAFCYAVGPMIPQAPPGRSGPARIDGRRARDRCSRAHARRRDRTARGDSIRRGGPVARRLGLFCTAAAFAFYGALVAEAGPGRALVITYIAPVVAVALGVAILGERPGAGAAAGLLLILAGSWLATGGRMPPGLRRPVAEGGRTRAPKPATQAPAPPSREPAATAFPAA